MKHLNWATHATPTTNATDSNNQLRNISTQQEEYFPLPGKREEERFQFDSRGIKMVIRL